jgi:MYXO-CTERM domain-containing protein
MLHVGSAPFTAAIFIALTPAALAADVPCFVDSVNGDDMQSGLSEAEAVKSQSKIGTTCTIVRYKRGSIFPEKVRVADTITTYTNYGDASAPLPKFQVATAYNSGPVMDVSKKSGITVDGLHLTGARNDGSPQNRKPGTGIVLGPNSKLLNSEIASCDYGIYLAGEASLVQNNNIRDIFQIEMPPGVYSSFTDGGQGILVAAPNNEVASNSLVRCNNPSPGVGAGCTGGAAEVMATAGKMMNGTKMHHNFIYDNCGLIKIARSSGTPRSKFSDAEIYNNVGIDSGWMAYLEAITTDFEKVNFHNNTVVQHAGSTNAGLLMVVTAAASSSSPGADLQPNTVFLTNNLFVLDGVAPSMDLYKSFVQATNLILETSKQDPGFVNLKGTAALDFDLLPSSPAVNAGNPVPEHTLDFANRVVPDPSGKTDIGAFEYTPGSSPMDSGSLSTGGTTRVGSGGVGGVTSNKPDGATGATTIISGKGGAGGMTTAPTSTGGAVGATTVPSGTGGVNGDGGMNPLAVGSGGSTVFSGGGVPGTGGGTANPPSSKKSGCSCRVGQVDSGASAWPMSVGFALLALRRRNRHH